LLPQALHAAAVVGGAYPLHEAPPELLLAPPELLLLLVPPLLLLVPLLPLLLLEEEELVPLPDDDAPDVDASDFVALDPSAAPPPSSPDEPDEPAPGLVVGSVCAGGAGSVGSVVVSAPAPVIVSVAPTAHAATDIAIAKEAANANGASRTNNASCMR